MATDKLPTGVELTNGRIRIRFMWNGRRCCETLDYPPTPQGIQAAAGLRTQVVHLAKLGVLTDAKYVELFPTTRYAAESLAPYFGAYAQAWLDTREIQPGTRRNYKNSLAKYWLPHLYRLTIDAITTVRLRTIVAETQWPSSNTKRVAIQHLRLMFTTAVNDGTLTRNPAAALELPKIPKKRIDPFTRDEAEAIIAHLYRSFTGSMRIYAAYFEFAFFTGMRMGEVMALRWDEIDLRTRMAHVCRIVVDKQVEERTKTGQFRLVMLNSRALNALDEARRIQTLRMQQRRQFPTSPYVFPPVKKGEFIAQAFVTHKHFTQALRELGIRRRPQYNTRHTYATLCLMAGLNPAFVAKQLGHSVQMLLSRYGTWIEGEYDWAELDKLEDTFEKPVAESHIGIKLVHTKNDLP